MAEGEFRNRWRVELEGDANVRAKLDALLTLQQKGLRATNEEIAAGRQAATSINSVNRAQTALIRSWQASHPQLSLMVRGLSSLAAVGRTVVGIITSINVMQLRQIEQQRNLREAQQDVITKQKLYNDALREFGADHPETIKRMQELNAALEELGIVTKQIDADKLQDIGLGIGNIFTALGSVAQIGTAIAIFRSLGVGVGIAAATMAAFVGSIVALGALIVLTNEQFDALLKTLGLFDIVHAIDATWQDFKQDWIEIFDVLGKTVGAFAVAIPKYFQIMAIRAIRFFTDMWNGFLSVVSNIGDKVKNTVKGWVDGVVKFFQDLYKKLVGGSIVPEMMDKINEVVGGGLSMAENKFQKFGLNVEGIMKNMGERVGNIIINDFQRATDAVSRIEDVARTRSLTKEERQQLQEAQTTQHVLGGAAGAVNTTRSSGYASMVGAINETWRRLIGYAPGGQAATNMLNQNPSLVPRFNSMLQEVRREQQQGNTTIIVQGSLITERELVTKVSQAIAQAV